MREYNKKSIIKIIIGIFLMCGIIKDIEFMVLKTDQTVLAENIICKIFCILMITTVLTILGLKWKELGFVKKGCLTGLKYGLFLGVSTFAVSYLVEFIILWCQGKHPHLGFYVTNFSMSEQNVTGLSLTTIVICILGNIVNVWAEEGLFRGLFMKIGEPALRSKGANMLQAVLFGIWHLISVVLWVKEGSMTIPVAIVFGFGYVALAWILAYEWGICKIVTGTVWTGIFEHFFNNFINNALHTVTETGVDELQIIRIVISNIMSLSIVLLAAKHFKKKNLAKRDSIC